MNFHVLTLFPEMIGAALGTSITGRAMEKGLLSLDAVNIRDFAEEKRKSRIDDYPYGGGAGLQGLPFCHGPDLRSCRGRKESGSR